MRWRCAAGIFHRSAVFSRRTSALLHLTICLPQIRWRKRITPRPRKTILEAVYAAYLPRNSRFKPFWRWYKQDNIPDDSGKELDTLIDAYEHARVLIDKILFHVGYDDADLWKVVISNDDDDAQMIVPFAVSHAVRSQRRGTT